MIKDGIKAGEVKVVSFEKGEAETLATFINVWLEENKYNVIYDISFQQGNAFSAFIVYKQVEEPSNEAPQQRTLY